MTGGGDDPAAHAAGPLLLRSAAEIAGALEAARADGVVLTASVQRGELLFLSRLLQVDPERRFLVVAFSELRPANHVLLECAAATFDCNHRGTHLGFRAENPREIEFRGAPAIRLDFPASLLRQQRRAHLRHVVPPRVPLHCVADWGPFTFEARVVDVSRGGLGAITYDCAILLEPGTRLPRVRISHPARTMVVALEVRHVSRILLPGGRPAMRAGCRLTVARHDFRELLQLFVTDLDA